VEGVHLEDRKEAVKELERAARRVLGRRAKVVPFGSVAKGRAVPGSDLDVMVISEDVPSSIRERAEVAHRILREAGLSEEDVDLLIMSPEEFESWGRLLLGSESDDTRSLVEELSERGRRFLAAAEEFKERGWDDLATLHAHQAIELTVKAALIASGESPPRTHYLGKLLGRLHEVTGDERVRALAERYRWELRELSHAWFEARYGRYPGEDIEVGDLVEAARHVVRVVRNVLEDLLGGSTPRFREGP